MNKLLTVYDVINQAQRELGLTQQPIQTAVSSADHDIAQMLALLSVVADEVLMDEPYRETLGDGYWLSDAVTGNEKAAPTADTDIVLFDGRVAIAGVKFRFMQTKGLEFGELLRDFTDRMNRLSARVNARVIDLNTEDGRQV
jgi:hypothetical protein